MFVTRKTLLSSLHEAQRNSVEFNNYCAKVKIDLSQMEKDEISEKKWDIPSTLPRAMLLKQIKKQNHFRLKFTISALPQTGSLPDSWILHVWDPRPNEYYRYGR